MAECLDDITSAASRAADLTRQMLAYSGKGRFVVERLDLSELVADMAHLLRASVSKKATVEYDLDAGVPAVEADPEQLRQLVMSLVTNASDALGAGGGVVRVSVGSRLCDRQDLKSPYLDEDLPAGRYASIEVDDDGVDGVEGVELFRKNAERISCVLLDLSMPRMDGEETLRELRRIDPDVRVILSSGYDERDVARRFEGLSLAGFASKPYRLATLAEGRPQGPREVNGSS